MKKKLNLALLSGLAVILLAGCATIYPVGMLYSDVAVPVTVGTGDGSYSKVGTAKTMSYFTLIATGDSSIEAAAKNGGVTRIKYVDHKVKNFLGIYGEYTTYVYGD
ncbi:MAG: protein trl [Candidatus Omnitrophica bacterium]|nr:protein trl [Candidatus Omnitrophota bacterium]